MNINKTKTAVVAVVLVSGALAFIIAGYFVLVFFFGPAKPKSERASIPLAGQNIRIPKFKSVTTPISKSAEGVAIPSENLPPGDKLNAPVLPIPKPDLTFVFKEKKLPTSAMSFFESIYRAAKSVETKLKKEIAAPIQSFPGALSDASTLESKTGIPIFLTNDEFHFLYPDIFIASLADAQNLLQRYDPTYQPLLKIETDSQVRFVEENIIAALFSANMLTKDEAERFLTTVRFTLPQLQLIELKNRKSQSFNQSSILSFTPLFSQPLAGGPFFSGLIEKLNGALKPAAEAGGGSPCGACFQSPLCFQEGASLPAVPGINVFKAFCYCTGCLKGQGCLDFCSPKAAIYDPITGLCGCG